MDNEATRLINDKPAQKEQTTSAQQSQSEVANAKKTVTNNPVMAAVGGFVAGAGVGVGATATAKNTAEGMSEVEDVSTEDSSDVEIPSPEQVILANDERIRVAHVVADNFSEAYSQARAQVGAGGVFEYEGKLYNTFTAEEWGEMSNEERIDFQNRVNDVAPSHYATNHHASDTIVTDQHGMDSEIIPTDAEMISAEPVDNEIRVLGVEAVKNDDGQIMNIALVECEGDQALLVDVDNNGTIDVLLHDDNSDGCIQDSEVYDVSDAGIEVADLLQTQAAQEGNMLYASNDDMPDYINDSDTIVTV